MHSDGLKSSSRNRAAGDDPALSTAPRDTLTGAWVANRSGLLTPTLASQVVALPK